HRVSHRNLTTLPTPTLPLFFFHCPRHHRDLHSFPTRRSSDLCCASAIRYSVRSGRWMSATSSPSGCRPSRRSSSARVRRVSAVRDRKSTRLNFSHVAISYAVFCLNKKNSAYDDNVTPPVIGLR